MNAAEIEQNKQLYLDTCRREIHTATAEPLGGGAYMIHSSAPIHGVAPGQFCVVYDEDHHKCYGSGEIAWME